MKKNGFSMSFNISSIPTLIPGASTTTTGVVRLSNEVDNSSSVLAATTNAVATLNERITELETSDDTHIIFYDGLASAATSPTPFRLHAPEFAMESQCWVLSAIVRGAGNDRVAAGTIIPASANNGDLIICTYGQGGTINITRVDRETWEMTPRDGDFPGVYFVATFRIR